GDLVLVGSTPARAGRAPVVVAIDSGPAASAATAGAIELATQMSAPIDVLHVQEVDVIGEDAVDRESLAEAQAVVEARLADMRSAGVEATGHVLRSVADHANIGRLIAGYASRVGARVVVIGEPTSPAFARLLDQDSSRRLIEEAPCDVMVVGTQRKPEVLTPA